MFWKLILLFFVLFLKKNDAQNHLCEQVEIIFVIDSSEATNGTFYNQNIKNFVSTVSNSFLFTDDVQPGSKQHARFALASYGDTYHFKYDFLRDETRNRWSKTVDGHFVFKNFGFGVASNGLGLAEQILEVSSVDMNRVIILMTSVVTKDDVNHPNTRYIHDLAPVVFGIGFPDVNGTNHVAENKTNMVMIAQNRTEWVYDSIDAALASKTGILSQIVQAFPCNQIQCSGFIFIVEDTFQTNSSIATFLNVTSQLVSQLPQNSNGFQFLVVDDSEVELFPFESAAGVIDRMNNFWYEPQFSPLSPKLDLLFADLIRVVDKKEFQNYGIVIFSETDYIGDTFLTELEAKRLGQKGAQIFVVDMSTNPKDNGKTFNSVTNNQQNHIIKGTGLNSDQLFAQMQNVLIPTLKGFKC